MNRKHSGLDQYTADLKAKATKTAVSRLQPAASLIARSAMFNVGHGIGKTNTDHIERRPDGTDHKIIISAINARLS